jgi:thioredoxin 1
MSNVQAVTDATFAAEVEGRAGVTVVDFWATWCAPCRAIAPCGWQLADDYAGRAKIVKLDTDSSPQAMVRHGVRGLPTLLFFKDGRVVDKVVGAVPRATIEAKLRAHLEPAAAAR